jgi:hypothetical protein
MTKAFVPSCQEQGCTAPATHEVVVEMTEQSLSWLLCLTHAARVCAYEAAQLRRSIMKGLV